jgi:hypothetical protein
LHAPALFFLADEFPMYIIKPEVQKLTEDEVQKALAHKDEENLIVVELSRVLQDIVAQYSSAVREGRPTHDILNKQAGCPLEKVALDMLNDIVGAETARQRKA